MPLYLIERQFADQLEATREGLGVDDIKVANDQAGVEWLFSFLSADRKKTYCLYEATSPEAISEAARLAGLPADVIVEVSELRPDLIPSAAVSSG